MGPKGKTANSNILARSNGDEEKERFFFYGPLFIGPHRLSKMNEPEL